MYYEQDWVMRQISMMTSFIAGVLFHKKCVNMTLPMASAPGYADDLFHRLKTLLLKRRFCDAEDLLWENLNVHDPNCLQLALDFYHTLNQFSEEELAKGNFSREEIQLGLNSLLRRYDITVFE